MQQVTKVFRRCVFGGTFQKKIFLFASFSVKRTHQLNTIAYSIINLLSFFRKKRTTQRLTRTRKKKSKTYTQVGNILYLLSLVGLSHLSKKRGMSLSKIGIQFFFALDYSKYMCCCTTDFGRHHFSFLYNFEKCVILSLRYCCYYF